MRQMRPRRFFLRMPICASLFVALTSVSLLAFAEDPKKAASAHFQQGVALFGEADYSAALVEFRSAYSLYPDVNVLYNIGETEFQLQHYAAALTALERYVGEGGSVHRPEAQEQVTTLKARVGKIALTSNIKGAEVLIDDESVGTTPLAAPVLATIGHRKVQLNPPGGAPVSRYVDVASGETAALTLDAEPARDARVADIGAPGPQAEKRDNTRVIVGWSATGAFAVATTITGVLAINAASKLKDTRESLGATPSAVDDKHSTLRTFEITTDVLGALTVVAAGVSLYWTLTRPSAPSSSSAMSLKPWSLSGTF